MRFSILFGALAASLLTTVLFAAEKTTTLTVEAGKSVAPVSPMLYGLMTEEINYSYDGGLYAELIRNRTFQDDSKAPAHWSLVQEAGASAAIELDKSKPLNESLPVSLRLDAKSASAKSRVGIANDGYWGIPVKPKTCYRASFYAKAAAGFAGPVSVAIESDDGKTVYAKGEVASLGPDWKQYSLALTVGEAAPTAKTRFVLSIDKPGTVWFNLVSLFPPTWNNRPNGNRIDLMQMLVDLNPKFLRFPGGNYLEGDYVKDRFPWQKTLGPLSDRPGHQCPWGYRSSDGMGLLEFLYWCEEMKAEPVLGVYVGYSLKGADGDPNANVKTGADLEPFVKEALDEIEYVIGDVSTKWGAQRAKDGHPAPFKLTYVEIGNEDWFDKTGRYDARFAQFSDAIKKKYPQLKLISSVGYEQSKNKWVKSRTPDAVDEHYYLPADQFEKKSHGQYDKYDRKGPKIFVGEWAAHETDFPPWDKRSEKKPATPNLKAALGDAVWMAEMERNSDVVVMHCYAPLLVNVNPGGRQWRPDLIGYDALNSFGAPSYYAIKMFSTNVGDGILKTKIDAEKSPLHCSATKDSKTGEIFLKVVNYGGEKQTVNLALKDAGALAATAEVETLSSASPDDTNSITEPTKVAPKKSEIKDVKESFSYAFQPYSVTVIKLKPAETARKRARRR